MFSCPEKGEGETLLNYLYTGSISTIRDNGRTLTIGLSPHWSTLPSGVRNDTYQAVACYAQSQQRAFHLTEAP
jgi:hypothetical protein